MFVNWAQSCDLISKRETLLLKKKCSMKKGNWYLSSFASRLGLLLLLHFSHTQVLLVLPLNLCAIHGGEGGSLFLKKIWRHRIGLDQFLQACITRWSADAWKDSCQTNQNLIFLNFIDNITNSNMLYVMIIFSFLLTVFVKYSFSRKVKVSLKPE